MEMYSKVYVILLAIHCLSVLAVMPPENGIACKPSFKEINPLKIMEPWIVVEHTDNLMPAAADCYFIKFARRCDMNSNFRMDVKARTVTDDAVAEVDIMRAGVKATGGNPFTVHIGSLPAEFPPNLMITDLNTDSGCIALWTCKNFESSAQKGAWIACKTTDVDPGEIKKAKENLSKNAAIDLSHFVKTNLEKCDI